MRQQWFSFLVSLPAAELSRPNWPVGLRRWFPVFPSLVVQSQGVLVKAPYGAQWIATINSKCIRKKGSVSLHHGSVRNKNLAWICLDNTCLQEDKAFMTLYSMTGKFSYLVGHNFNAPKRIILAQHDPHMLAGWWTHSDTRHLPLIEISLPFSAGLVIGLLFCSVYYFASFAFCLRKNQQRKFYGLV